MEKTAIIYRVFAVKRNDGCDVFIPGIDDFKPADFTSEEEAEDFILKKNEGSYYIRKIYIPNGNK